MCCLFSFAKSELRKASSCLCTSESSAKPCKVEAFQRNGEGCPGGKKLVQCSAGFLASAGGRHGQLLRFPLTSLPSTHNHILGLLLKLPLLS